MDERKTYKPVLGKKLVNLNTNSIFKEYIPLEQSNLIMALLETKDVAKRMNSKLKMTFKGISIDISPQSNYEDIEQAYHYKKAYRDVAIKFRESFK